MDALAAAAASAVGATLVAIGAAEVRRDALLTAALLPGRAAGAVRAAERLADAAVAALPVRAPGDVVGAAGRVDEAFAAAA